MAVGKLCDRCGVGFKFKKHPGIVNGIAFTHFDEYGKAANTVNTMELCPSCLELVYEATKPLIEDDEDEDIPYSSGGKLEEE